MKRFDGTKTEREALLQMTTASLLEFYEKVSEHSIGTIWPHEMIASKVEKFDFKNPQAAPEAIQELIENLKQYTIHTPHPNYFGLFNPRPNFPSILADLITAFLNPQLAAWSHAPYAAEIERNLIHQFCTKFGYPTTKQDGTFTSGGAESNLTALICALNQYIPDFNTHGLLKIQQLPRIYCSAESHHSIVKAARSVGLGAAAVIKIPAAADQCMNIQLLAQQIEQDQVAGHLPLMIVGTAGTTGSGAIDDLHAIATLCETHDMWFHVDAAYGGALVLSVDKARYLAGIERSDSITMDIHKWFSVPMGVSVFLTTNPTILHQAFSVSTAYMPKKGEQPKEIDPYVHSIQWSRRFMGLKLHLPLLLFGWKGYQEVIDGQMEQADLLRQTLTDEGWTVHNDTVLPIVCFSHPALQAQPDQAQKLVDGIVRTGKAWISTYPIGEKLCIRACITNYNTDQKAITDLMNLLKEHLTLQRASHP